MNDIRKKQKNNYDLQSRSSLAIINCASYRIGNNGNAGNQTVKSSNWVAGAHNEQNPKYYPC